MSVRPRSGGTFAARIRRSLALMIVPLLVVGAVGLVSAERAKQETRELTEEVVMETRAVEDVLDSIRFTERAISRELARPDGRVEDTSERAIVRVDASLEELRSFDERAERDLVARAERGWRAARASARAALTRRPGGTDEPRAFFLASLDVREDLGGLMSVGLAEIELDRAVLERHQQVQLGILIVTVLLACVAGLLLARRIVDALQRPLIELDRAARHFGDEDFGHRARIEGAHELADLGQAMNAMAERLERSHRDLHHRAFHDELTGLLNRAALGQAVQRRLDAGACVGVLHVALADFAAVNDALGRADADRVLSEVARRLVQAFEPAGTVARVGSVEFGVLVDSPPTPGELEAAGRRIQVAVGAPLKTWTRTIELQTTIGSVRAGPGSTTGDCLVRDADIALSVAKRVAPGGHRSFEPSMREDAIERLELESDLRAAIDRGQLELHYQPVVDTATGRWNGLEALVRWRHPVRGLIPPCDFIPLAERTGLVVPLGRWVLGEACEAIRRLEGALPDGPIVKVGVNLSTRHLARPDVVDDVFSALAMAGVDASRLVVEITESALAGDVAETAGKLATLRSKGVTVALDDFGTGYSSLSYLSDFPIDILKIDRSFIDRIDQPGAPHDLVRTIIGLGRVLQLGVVAEGVETEAQRAALVSLGCGWAQGFHFARPMPAAEVHDRVIAASAVRAPEATALNAGA